jgi:hypothetical protein
VIFPTGAKVNGIPPKENLQAQNWNIKTKKKRAEKLLLHL